MIQALAELHCRKSDSVFPWFFHGFFPRKNPQTCSTIIFVWVLAPYLLPDPNCSSKHTNKSRFKASLLHCALTSSKMAATCVLHSPRILWTFWGRESGFFTLLMAQKCGDHQLRLVVYLIESLTMKQLPHEICHTEVKTGSCYFSINSQVPKQNN